MVKIKVSEHSKRSSKGIEFKVKQYFRNIETNKKFRISDEGFRKNMHSVIESNKKLLKRLAKV